MTLMKVRLNCKDLAVRFDISRETASNVVNSYISVLHEILFDVFLKLLAFQANLNGKVLCLSLFKTLVLLG